MASVGVLILNLGTPAAADGRSVKKYLRQFLNDPRVIDLPWWVRVPLVNGLIIPFRYRQSSHAYQQVWTEKGSPLFFLSQSFCEKLAITLGQNYQVALGFRYGKPSIAEALSQLKHCRQLVVIPMFPQYASASTGSALAEVYQTLSHYWNQSDLHILGSFYDDPGFIHSSSLVIRETLEKMTETVDYYLFSYHGLPERHIYKSGCDVPCRETICPKISHQNQFCYRAQCFATTSAIAKELSLDPVQFSTSFQSRLGRTPWIQPYTDVMLTELLQKGIKNMIVVCPSFVTDCLETLEEIHMRAKEQWIDGGGNTFNVVPCLNDRTDWVNTVASWIHKKTE
jgi:ferrochelatase